MSGIQGLGNVGGMNLSGMDIETALLAVQSQRTQLLDSQLADQIKGVQGRNDAISKLNAAMGSVSSLQGVRQALQAQHVHLLAVGLRVDRALDRGGRRIEAALGRQVELGGIHARRSQRVLGVLDQLFVLGVIGYFAARVGAADLAESFDVMTNFVKKMQDSRSSIIGNMR